MRRLTFPAWLAGDGPAAFLARGASGALLVKVAGSLLLLLSQVVLARRLGASAYGAFMLAFAWVQLLALVAKAGLDNTILRFGAAYRDQGRWGLLRGLLTGSNRIVLASSLATVVLAASFVAWRREALGGPLTATLLVAWAGVPFAALSGLRQAALRAFRAVVRAQVPETIVRPVVLLALLGVTWRRPLDGPGAAALHVVALAAAYAVGAVWLRRREGDALRAATPESSRREWFDVAGFLLLVSVINLLMNRVDTLLLGAFLDTDAVGTYAAASRLVVLIQFGMLAMSSVVAPMIAEAHGAGRIDELRRLVVQAGWGILAYALPVSFAMIVAGKRILAWFGEEFVAAYPLLVVLAIGHLVNALTGVVSFMMSMTGQQRALASIMGGFLLVNVATTLVLLPRLGAMGAAIGTTVATAGWNIAATVRVYRRTGVDCLVFAGLYRR